MAERLQVLDGRHWASLNVEGSLSWDHNLPRHILGLGYYLGAAVTRTEPQIFSGEIEFVSPVSVNNFDSSRDINDYDISSILQDSLKKSFPDQVINLLFMVFPGCFIKVHFSFACRSSIARKFSAVMFSQLI